MAAYKTKLTTRFTKRAVQIFCAMLVLAFCIAFGVYIAMFLGARSSLKYQAVLTSIESGAAFKDESAEYKARADTAAKKETIQILPGLYVATKNDEGVIYDVALRLSGGGQYDYRLSVGNGSVHKTYIVHGAWAVVGEVLHLSYSHGDAFLLSPAAKTATLFEREIITAYSQDTGMLSVVSNSGSAITLKKFSAIDDVKPPAN